MILSVAFLKHAFHYHQTYHRLPVLTVVLSLLQWSALLLIQLILLWLDLLSLTSQDPSLCLPRNCDTLLEETYTQICTNYQAGRFLGTLCPALCSPRETHSEIRLVSCPNFSGHTGKDCVIRGLNQSSNQPLIIKSRFLFLDELLGREHSTFRATQANYLPSAITNLLSGHLPSTITSNITAILEILSPYDSSGHTLSQVELENVWFLLQDNEYIRSASQSPTSRLFPPVIATCGHFYALQYLPQIIDFTYFVPSLAGYQLRSVRERVQLALDLLQFLHRFLLTEPKLELCDVKYSHFAYHGRQLLLLDSDMIYPLSIVNQSIVSTPFCHSDADCHFIDCQGVCSHHGRCQLNPLDTDLKRLCRNLLFMGSLYGGLLDFGLLTFAQPKEAYLRLRAHCFDPQNGHRNQTDAQHLLAIQRILGQIQASL